jgi:hypothetical protein
MKTGNMNSISRIQGSCRISMPFILSILTIGLMLAFLGCKKDDTSDITPTPTGNDKYTIEQTVSDQAQQNTLSFDALAFMTGSLGAQTFLPPGKVADYSGFQYLRDNDVTNLGHNTSFVTIIAFNMLHLLTEEQLQMYVDAARVQVDLINEYAYQRYPLCKAFRRLINGDLPAGTTMLDEDEVKNYSAALYRIDGEISYNRAKLFGEVIGSMSDQQLSQLAALKALNGIGNWDSSLTNPLESYHLEKDVNVAVMTYASEMYAWWAGSVEADVYFCPERQGTYFGSFYLKDWPAMGNPNYTINEQLTATAGQDFLNILNQEQKSIITGIVADQKSSLLGLVDTRRSVSNELRKFLSGTEADSQLVYSLSEDYGRQDGEIIYLYATHFAEVFNSISPAQKDQLESLADNLGYLDPSGGFLYSDPIAMPEIDNTDHFFK